VIPGKYAAHSVFKDVPSPSYSWFPRSVIKCVSSLFCPNMLKTCSSLVQNSPVDVTMGPYETYKDGLFGYKVIISPFFRAGG
jgi:hypothetical protein